MNEEATQLIQEAPEGVLDLSEVFNPSGSKDYDFILNHPNPKQYPNVKFKVRHAGAEVLIDKLNKVKELNTSIINGEETVDAGREGLQFSFELFDYALVDWEGFYSQGQKVPCDSKNKAIIFNKFQEVIVKWLLLEVKKRVARQVGFDIKN